MKILVVDPRHTATCELADMHLPLRSGTESSLFASMRRSVVDCWQVGAIHEWMPERSCAPVLASDTGRFAMPSATKD